MSEDEETVSCALWVGGHRGCANVIPTLETSSTTGTRTHRPDWRPEASSSITETDPVTNLHLPAPKDRDTVSIMTTLSKREQLFEDTSMHRSCLGHPVLDAAWYTEIHDGKYLN